MTTKTWNNIFPNFETFENLAINKFSVFYPNYKTIVSWNTIYIILSEKYGLESVRTGEQIFLVNLKNTLIDIIPTYNEKWKIALSDVLTSLTPQSLLEFGDVTTNEQQQTSAQTPAYEKSAILDDDYVNEIIKTTLKDKTLKASVLQNITKWVNTKIQITNLVKFIKEFDVLFSPDFGLFDTDETPTPSELQNILLRLGTLEKKTSNLNVDGDILETTYNPSAFPHKGADQNMVKNVAQWNYDAEGNIITNAGDPINKQDVATKNSLDLGLKPLQDKTLNLNDKGEVVSTDFDPVGHPQRIPTQKQVQENGGGASSKLLKTNNIVNSRNLATQNVVSNVGENLKEGGAEFFQSYQYATLPLKSVVIDATERIIPFPKGTNKWENEITFTPLKDSTYLFKNLFFFNLNQFPTDNKKFVIKQVLTDKNAKVYNNPIAYDLNDIKNVDIQANKWSNFVKVFEQLDVTKAPYTYKQTIQGLEGSTSSLLINTETTGGESLYPASSHMSIIEMIPSGTVFAYDKDVEVSDPNDYTYYGWDPKSGSNIVSVLQYAMSEVEYSKLLGRVIKIGEDTDKNITKVLIDSPVPVAMNNQKIVEVKDGVNDQDVPTMKQLKAAEILLEKQSVKDIITVDKFLLDAFIYNADGFSEGIYKTLDLGLFKTYESWVDTDEIATDQLKITLKNIVNKSNTTMSNGEEFFINITDIETSTDIQYKIMREINTEKVNIKFNLRKDATNLYLDIINYGSTAVSQLKSLNIQIDLIKMKGVKSVKGDKGPKGDPGHVEYTSTNYQKFTSDTYPGDIDNTLRTIEGWAEKLKNKTLFYSQSNGAFVIDENYRQEISKSVTDRYVRMDFSCSGFTARTGDFLAQVTTSGNFDFDGEIFLVKKGIDTSSNSYLGSNNNEIYSLVFRIPHTIASGDLMFIELKSSNCGIADVRPPYHLSFTELGNQGNKGAKGDPGDPGGAGVRETMYDESTTLNNNQSFNFNILGDGNNNSYKNIQITLTDSGDDWGLVKFINNLNDQPSIRFRTIQFAQVPVIDQYVVLELISVLNFIKVSNFTNKTETFTLKVTGEKIPAPRKKEKTNGKNTKQVKTIENRNGKK